MKSLKKRFYTLIELVVCFGLLLFGAGIIGLIYVGIHFLKKCW